MGSDRYVITSSDQVQPDARLETMRAVVGLAAEEGAYWASASFRLRRCVSVTAAPWA